MPTAAKKPTSSKSAKPTISYTLLPDPTALEVSWFQRGYQSGVHAAGVELSQNGSPFTAESIYSFIAIRLDPEHIQRQRDADKNPLPPAYHAGFVAGYLSTLFVPPSQEVAE